MKFSPAHIKEIVGISQETLRHWRTVLPPLETRKGRNIFSPGDALAFLVIKDLCSTLKIKISQIAPIAEDLFNLCSPIKWEDYQNKFLVLLLTSNSLEIMDEFTILSSYPGPAILININIHISTLKKYALGISDNAQFELHFPPRLVRRI